MREKTRRYLGYVVGVGIEIFFVLTIMLIAYVVGWLFLRCL
ncbi:MAG: hypothetical protein QMD66_05545 [Actinomycetota bacterium]|nr:hypothetical protein [Actinomycetota bacterium]MDI6822302.1 hypothetical protein [Actinomycetota bacterium]